MPLREYSCKSCGHRFEKLERGGRRTRVRCPQCGDMNVVKAFSSFAVAAATSTPSPDIAPCGACGAPVPANSCAVDA